MTQAVGTEPAATQAVVLGLGDWQVTADPEAVLGCLGLGSCVALIVHDASLSIGARAHIVRPDSRAGRTTVSEAKFVDIAVPKLVDEMLAAGANRARIHAGIVGGASMLLGSMFADTIQVGARNIAASRVALQRASVHLGLDETGGGHGRTVWLHVASGEVEVSTAGVSSRRMALAEEARRAA